MAEQTYYNFITDLGTAKITNAILTGAAVNLTHFAVGDGGGSSYQPNPQMTRLKNEVWRGSVTAVESDPDQPGNLYVRAVVPSEIGGFTIREMAVFDEAGDLIAIANTADVQKVSVSSGMSTEIELTMHLVVDNTGAIQFVVDPLVVIASKKDILDHDANPQAHPAKADKVSDAAAGHLAALDADGNLTDSGKAPADFAAADHTHTAEDVGARPNTWTPTAADVGARPSTWTPTAADVGAAVTATYSATLPSAGWSATAPFSQTVAVAGITAVMNPLVDVILSEETAAGTAELEAYGYISYIQTGDGTITAVCFEDKPAVDLLVQLKVVQ